MPPAYSAVHHKYVEHYHRTGERRLLGIPRILPAQTKDGNVVKAEVQLRWLL
jgi:two-component system sensor kinase FixL